MNIQKLAASLFLVIGISIYGRTITKQWWVERVYYSSAFNYFYSDLLVKRGVNIYELTQEDIIKRKQAAAPQFEGAATIGGMWGGTYAPAFFLLVAPMTWWKFTTGNLLWMGLVHFCLFMGLYAVFRATRGGWTMEEAAPLIFLICVFHPLLENMLQGQNNTLVLCSLGMAGWSLIRGQEHQAGWWLAPAMLMKPQFGLIIVYWLWKKRYAAVGALGLGYLVVTALAIAAVGIQPHLSYYRKLFFELPALHAHLPSNISLMGWLTYVAGARTAWVELGYLGMAAIGAVLLARIIPRDQAPTMVEMASIVTLALLFSPNTTEHHLVMVLIPVIVLGRTPFLWLYISAVVLIGFGYWTALADGLKYGRTLGLILLWWVGVLMLRKKQNA